MSLEPCERLQRGRPSFSSSPAGGAISKLSHPGPPACSAHTGDRKKTPRVLAHLLKGREHREKNDKFIKYPTESRGVVKKTVIKVSIVELFTSFVLNMHIVQARCL